MAVYFYNQFWLPFVRAVAYLSTVSLVGCIAYRCYFANDVSMSELVRVPTPSTMAEGVAENQEASTKSDQPVSSSGNATLSQSNGSRPHGQLKKRPPINQNDLEPWKHQKRVSIEKTKSQLETHEGCGEPECEAHYWQVSWKREKDRADKQEKSATHLEKRLAQCQKNVKLDKDKAIKQEQKANQLETEMSELRSRLNAIEQDRDAVKAERDQLHQAHASLNLMKNEHNITIGRLQTQVAEYKRQVATYSSDSSQLSDDQIKSNFDSIFNRIRNIAVRLCKSPGFGEFSCHNLTKST